MTQPLLFRRTTSSLAALSLAGSGVLAAIACSGEDVTQFVLPQTPAEGNDGAPGPGSAAPDGYVETAEAAGAVPLVVAGQAAPLLGSSADHPGVRRVLGDVAADFERVSGVASMVLLDAESAPAANVILAGTLGQNPAIDALVSAGKLDVSDVAGRWETFVVDVVEDPVPGAERGLVIAGSDPRGTMYGLYDLSRQIGVSPWYYWADVPPERHDALYATADNYTLGEPAVKYRGIFLNDEAPALEPWANQTFGDMNADFYAHVFELMLRLKANYLWPAMWNSAFYQDDERNQALAMEYGIVMGTSHHEPLTRAQQEWTRLCASEAGCGEGEEPWNFDVNAERLSEFWREGVERIGDQEVLVTIGMRGDGDEPLTADADIELLERIVAAQRQIIADVKGSPDAVPQVWQLYKEVQDYYDQGMEVPEDVTLLFADDNFGNIRKLPRLDEERPGGYGVYYHFDYVGGPRNYKWLNTNPLPRVWEQMHLAHEYGADRIWIVNVGDIKPMELPITFFLDYAWNPDAMPLERLPEYTDAWVADQFGPEHASEIAHLIDRYTFYTGRLKPEMWGPNVFSVTDYREAERMLAEYAELVAEAERLEGEVPEAARDAYYQLVLYPVAATGNLAELYYQAALNALYVEQGRAAANDAAGRVRALFRRDSELTQGYHGLRDGKWNRMMSQTHIGYTTWQEPPQNNMPEVVEIEVPEAAALGVALEGSRASWPSAEEPPALPLLSRYQPFADRYLEVFNRGQTAFDFTVQSSESWVRVEPASGSVDDQVRLSVTVDWDAAPEGESSVALTVSGAGEEVVVDVPIENLGAAIADGAGYIASGGVVSMEASHYTRAVGDVEWKTIDNLGRTLASVTPFPVTLASTEEPGGESARLEYQMYLAEAGNYRLQAYFAPTLPFHGMEQGLRYGVSIDDGPIQIVNLHAEELTEARWEQMIRQNAAIGLSNFEIGEPGEHVLKVWRVDPGVVLQKLVLSNTGLPQSFAGPPESFLRDGDSPLITSNPPPSSAAPEDVVAGEAPCSGCAVVSVPVDGGSQAAMFQITFDEPTDLSNAVITWRLLALTPGENFFVTPYAQNGEELSYAGPFRPQTPLTAGGGFLDEFTWADVSLSLAEIAPLGSTVGEEQVDPAGFDKSQVLQVGIQVGAAAAFTGLDTIQIAIDSITFEGIDPAVAPTLEFTSGLDGLHLNGYMAPTGTGEPEHHP